MAMKIIARAIWMSPCRRPRTNATHASTAANVLAISPSALMTAQGDKVAIVEQHRVQIGNDRRAQQEEQACGLAFLLGLFDVHSCQTERSSDGTAVLVQWLNS